MDKSQMMQRLMGTFLDELEEHVRSFNRDLLDLEKSPRAAGQGERFKTLFRTAHSLKGAARSVSVPIIEGACHRLEEILARARDEQGLLGAELMALLFATVDAIEEAGMRLREQQDLTDAPLAALLPRLDAAAAGTAFEPVASRPEAGPAPMAPRECPSTDAAVDLPPRAEPVSPALPGIAFPATKPTEVEAVPDISPSASLRVPAEKLDTLLARVGELILAQRRVEARLADCASLQEFVDHWRAEWKRLEPLLARERTSLSGGGGVSIAEKGTHALPRRAIFALRQAGDNLRRLEKTVDRLATALSADCRQLDHVTRALDDEVHRVRMLPFDEACAGLERMVRDLAHTAGKDVELLIEGGDVELDRSILEGLKDPLRHLIRNAIDHGLETPDTRERAGKPRRGRLKVSASLRGAQVQIHVQDDGRGLDLESIRAQARRRRLDAPEAERDLAQLIFLPGFSTASIITDVSGRGVGLDVVKNRVEALHGTVDLSFAPGQGTGFVLTVPLTLTMLRAVLVVAGGQTYAFAGTNVHKMMHLRPTEIHTIAGRAILPVDGAPVPLVSLGSVLNPTVPAHEHGDGKTQVLIVVTGTTRMAFVVGELLAEQEILVKSLGARIRRVPLLAGATLLPSGRIALVLNAANVVRSALAGTHAPPRRAASAPALPRARKKLLVVEDSMTTRTLMKSILEAAGFDVATAADGQAGWEYLETNEVDLVVSDVDMPRMDGFALAEAVRGSKKLGELPVILVTARENEPDKAHGIAVGANAYLVKSAFDQHNLLETIAQLL